MKRFVYILVIALLFISCKKSEKPKSSVLDLFTNAYYGETHGFSEWDNRYWELFHNHGKVEMSALTLDVSIAYFDSLRQVIENEFGAYEYCKATVPKEWIADTGRYWHLSKACYDAYYWSNDMLTVAWALHDLTDSVGYAYLDIKQLSLNWVLGLEEKNPLKDDWRTISVYFRFDTIINNFEVSGILYPNFSEEYGWSCAENGVRLFFRNIDTEKECVWTDWDAEVNNFKNTFMSKNVQDIVLSEDFKGFQDGDYYTFHYDTTTRKNPQNPLLPNAEYQFYDIDFDGEDELLLSYYHGGPKGCTAYEIYELTDTAIIKKEVVDELDHFAIDENTIINPIDKTITLFLWCSVCECGIYGYQVRDNGDICSAYHIRNYVNPENDSLISDTTYFVQ